MKGFVTAFKKLLDLLFVLDSLTVARGETSAAEAPPGSWVGTVGSGSASDKSDTVVTTVSSSERVVETVFRSAVMPSSTSEAAAL